MGKEVFVIHNLDKYPREVPSRRYLSKIPIAYPLLSCQGERICFMIFVHDPFKDNKDQKEIL
jgi:hypothetical protein